MKKEKSQQTDVRTLNIENAIGPFTARFPFYVSSFSAVANVVRTSLGPRGLDKLIIQPKGDVLITNDGATILKELEATHPCAKMVCLCGIVGSTMISQKKNCNNQKNVHSVVVFFESSSVQPFFASPWSKPRTPEVQTSSNWIPPPSAPGGTEQWRN